MKVTYRQNYQNLTVLTALTAPNESTQILLDLAMSVKHEALILLPNDKAMVRIERLGVIDYLIKASQENSASIIKFYD